MLFENDSQLNWLSVVLSERYGHSFRFAAVNGALLMKLEGAEGSVLFDRLLPERSWASRDVPFTHWDAALEGWQSILDLTLPAPGVSELPTPLIERCAQCHVIHYDILGLTYWMLARVEELGSSALDAHGRFSAKSSHAFKNGYLERPVIDEWMHLLGQVITRQWPNIRLAEHTFETRPSHDVDAPSCYAFTTPLSLLRRMGGGILRRRDVGTFFLAPWIRARSQANIHSSDPFNTFDWIMDASEKNGLKSAFYFICGRTDRKRDSDYEIEHPAIRRLLKRIHERGHEIGLHPSYGTYLDAAKVRQETERLRRVCNEERIHQPTWGCRMHFLRWSHPVTLRALEAAGFQYDSTMGYPDHVGFRCGTCHEYPAYDPDEKRIMNIRIRPLIAMECSIIDSKYMGLGATQQALLKLKQLKRSCMRVGGAFTLLWHNSRLHDQNERDIYRNVIRMERDSLLLA